MLIIEAIYTDVMWRFLSILILTAALGSLISTFVMSFLIAGYVEAVSSPIRAFLGVSVFTMVFTVPGTLMLFGFRAELDERGVAIPATNVLLLVFGMFAGSMMLLLVFQGVMPIRIGALYGFVTTAVFITLKSRIGDRLLGQQ